MALEQQLLERQIDVRDGLDQRERRALAEFLKDPARAADVAEEVRKNPEFSKVLKSLWDGAAQTLDLRTKSLPDLAAKGTAQDDAMLRAAQERTGAELETLFAAAKSLKAAGVDVGAAQARLHAIAQDFIDASTAENMGDHAMEDVWTESQVTVRGRGGVERQVTKREKSSRNVGLEASLRLVGPILETGTGAQAMNWLKDVHLRIAKDGWQDTQDAHAYRMLTASLHRQVLAKLAAEGDRADLVDFARTVSGRNGSVDRGLRDPGLAREALLAALAVGETGKDGKERRSVMERYVPEMKDPAVEEMGGVRGVVAFFRENYGAASESVMRQLGCPGAADVDEARFVDLPRPRQAQISMLARFAKEAKDGLGPARSDMEAEAGKAWDPGSGIFRTRAEHDAFRAAPAPHRDALARGLALEKAAGKAQEFAREIGRIPAQALAAALDGRTSVFGRLEDGLAVSPLEREAMQLFLDVQGVGALNFSDETLRTMGEAAKVAGVIAVSVAAGIATGGLAAGPIAAAMLGGATGAVLGGAVSVGVDRATGKNLVTKNVVTEQALNVGLSVVGGAATAKALQVALAARMAAELGKGALTAVEREAMEAAVREAVSASHGSVQAAADELATQFGVEAVRLAKSAALTKYAVTIGMDAANFAAGTTAEHLRKTLVMGEDSDWLEMVKSGAWLAAVTHAAGNAGSLRGGRAAEAPQESAAVPAEAAPVVPEGVPVPADGQRHSRSDGRHETAMFMMPDGTNPLAMNAAPRTDAQMRNLHAATSLGDSMLLMPDGNDLMAQGAARETSNLLQARETLKAAAAGAPAELRPALERRGKMLDDALADAETGPSYGERKAAHLAKPKPMPLEEAVAREKAAKEAAENERRNRTAGIIEAGGFRTAEGLAASVPPTERFVNPAPAADAPSPSANRPAPGAGNEGGTSRPGNAEAFPRTESSRVTGATRGKVSAIVGGA